LARLDADTSIALREMPNVDYNIERSYVFRDLNPVGNSIGYKDQIYRTNYPLLEAKITDLFFNRGCGSADFYEFVYEFKSKRTPFLFLDEINSKLKATENKLIETYTTLEQFNGIDYFFYQNYKYNNVTTKKPIFYYKLDSLSLDGVPRSVNPNTILKGPISVNSAFGILAVSGTFYTPVKIKEGKELETIQKSLRTVSELNLYEYPIFLN
jgi:hypothetical protein